MLDVERSQHRRTGVSNRRELDMDLNTAKRLKIIAGGKRSATTGLCDVHAIDPEGITGSRSNLGL